MSSPTTPRMPRLKGKRATAPTSGDVPPGQEALSHERAATGAGDAQHKALIDAVDAMEASAGAPEMEAETEEMRRQRIRRAATIIAASLLVSAIVSGAATVIARQIAARRASAASASTA